MMQAVLKPASASPKAALRPAPPAPLVQTVNPRVSIKRERRTPPGHRIHVQSKGNYLMTMTGTAISKQVQRQWGGNNTLTSCALSEFVPTIFPTDAETWNARRERDRVRGTTFVSIVRGRERDYNGNVT